MSSRERSLPPKVGRVSRVSGKPFNRIKEVIGNFVIKRFQLASLGGKRVPVTESIHPQMNSRVSKRTLSGTGSYAPHDRTRKRDPLRLTPGGWSETLTDHLSVEKPELPAPTAQPMRRRLPQTSILKSILCDGVPYRLL
jgi:hypothetical protein